jgi:hypothetical protein
MAEEGRTLPLHLGPANGRNPAHRCHSASNKAGCAVHPRETARANAESGQKSDRERPEHRHQTLDFAIADDACGTGKTGLPRAGWPKIADGPSTADRW